MSLEPVHAEADGWLIDFLLAEKSCEEISINIVNLWNHIESHNAGQEIVEHIEVGWKVEIEHRQVSYHSQSIHHSPKSLQRTLHEKRNHKLTNHYRFHSLTNCL